MAQQPDGKIIYGGDFTAFNGATCNRLARLNADGTLDATFNTSVGASGVIYSLQLQPDGKIVIGGLFVTYAGLSRVRVARVNADGSADASFNAGTGPNSIVRAVGLQTDGKILIGGSFTAVAGASRNRIARLNSDGTLDTSFMPVTGADGQVDAIGVQADDKILIGGFFANYNGTARARIARLHTDGSLDTSFSPGSGANNAVFTITLQTDGKLVLGGDFTSYNGTSRSRLARVNTDGTLDATFDPGTGADNVVFSTTIQSDGKIVIGGLFGNYNGSARNSIARVTTEGTLDAAFDPGTGADTQINAVLVQPDDKVLIAGAFSRVNGTFAHGRARLESNGSLDAAFTPDAFGGFNRIVWAIVVQPDQKILVAGDFTGYNGAVARRLIRLNTDGSVDGSFNAGNGPNSAVRSVHLQSDGKVVITGSFSDYNGTARNYIARVNADGSLDASFNPGTGANNAIAASALQADGKIVIGGFFTSFNGTTRNRIARVNTDGTLDTTFDPGAGPNININTISIQPDGKILIGGFFTSYAGTARNGIARLNADGTLDVSFNPGSGAGSGVVNSFVLQPDGKILVGGSFTSYNGSTTGNLTRVNADGSRDATFASGISGSSGSSVRSLGLQADGKILAGGTFITPRRGLLRLLPNGGLDTGFDYVNGTTGSFNDVITIAIQADNKILFGGDFFAYNAVGRNRLARLQGGDMVPPLNAADSLALVSIYNNTDSAFATALNWLTGPVHTWQGVSVGGGRVTEFLATGRNLSALPPAIENLTALRLLNLSSNRLTTLPNLAAFPLATISVTNNNLSFQDIQPYVGLSNFTYSPQTKLGVANKRVFAGLGEAVAFNEGTVEGTGNVYQWLKDGVPVGAAATYTIPSFALADSATYKLRVTNPAVPLLTLESHDRILRPLRETYFQLDRLNTVFGDTLNKWVYTISYADIDRDGDDDAFVGGANIGSTGLPNRLYENNGDGTFTSIAAGDVTSLLYDARDGSWGDIDNDGFPDLFASDLGYRSGAPAIAPVRVFRNNGNKTFTATTLPARFNLNNQESGSWGDANNDGYLDLAVAGSSSVNTPLALYRNNGNNTFSLDTLAFAGAIGSLGMFSWIDLNRDGWQDLFYSQSTSRYLFMNNGNGTFTPNTTSPLVTATISSSRGHNFFDIDNDGDQDCIILGSGSKVFTNDGAGNFTAAEDNVAFGQDLSGRPSAVGDFDNDGDQDFFVSASSSGNYLFLNNGSGTFTQATPGQQSFDLLNQFLGVSANDFNNDGFLDVTTGSSSLDPLGGEQHLIHAYRGKPNGNQWLKVSLNGRVSNRSGIGAVIEAKTGALKQTRLVSGHSGWGVHNGVTAHFGLAAAATIDSLTVTWPSGTIQRLANVSANQRITITEITPLDADSLALRTFYDSLGGIQWTNKTNWLSGAVNTWFGVVVNSGRVRALNLPNNKLSGKIPAVFTDLKKVTTANLSGNQLTGVVNFAALDSIAQIRIENNRLDFADLEPVASIANLVYAPQDSVEATEGVLRQLGTAQTFRASVGGSANNYQWKKNGVDMPGFTLDSIRFTNIQLADDALYTYAATNALVPGLTLNSRPKALRVSSLRRDSIALTALYLATSGNTWTNRTNWTTTPLGTGNWFGVTITSNRVTGLSLPNNNLTGPVPTVLADISNITTLNLAGNKISRLPDLRPLAALTNLNVSNNNLDFGSLIDNVPISGINYANQALIGRPLDSLIDVGSRAVVRVRTPGTGNVYSWKRNGEAVASVTDSVRIDRLTRINMGDYVMEVTNPAVPGLLLRSTTQRVRATATLTGKVSSTPTAPLNKGRVTLFKINSVGGYDTTAIRDVNAAGDYTFTRVVLDNYILLANPDTLAFADDLPTYYKSTIFWEEADSIQVQGNRTGLNIAMQKKPTVKPQGQGVIAGFLENTQTGGRVNANERVARAGATVRRRTRVARPTEDQLTLVGYVLTNDNGEFEFFNLEEGEYALNLQVPGFPMDPKSFINITIGKGLDRTVSVEALIKDNQITVNKLVVTGWDETDTRFSVYPNPASSKVMIALNEAVAGGSYVVLNALGAEVTAGDLLIGAPASIETADWPTGIYMVALKQNGTTVKIFRVQVMR
jgi:uncharacterized delta-60 repeat protein